MIPEPFKFVSPLGIVNGEEYRVVAATTIRMTLSGILTADGLHG